MIGAPYGISQTLTAGHVSGRRRMDKDGETKPYLEFLQTDAAVNGGNSGSPMFDMNGQVVGIVSTIMSQSGGSEGLAFATASNTTKRFLLDRKPFWSGIDGVLVTGELAKALNLPQPAGFLVQRIGEGSIGSRLVRYFAQKFARQMEKRIETIPTATMYQLTKSDWPGNVRELANFIERAVILTRGTSLDVPLAELHRVCSDEITQPAGPQRWKEITQIVRETMNALNMGTSAVNEHAERQRNAIVRTLTETKGRVGGDHGAAARLGLNRITLLSRMKKLGLHPKQFC